jgi:hypothetical protein
MAIAECRWKQLTISCEKLVIFDALQHPKQALKISSAAVAIEGITE